MVINADSIRGHTETIILANLLHKDSYGYEINKSIQEKTMMTFEFKEATLYSALRRLESEGYIGSYWGNEATGARRRYYKITQEGIAKYERNKAEWQETKALIDKLI